MIISSACPARAARRMDVQVAEQPAERQVLVGRDVLVAEEDDAVLGQRTMDLVVLAVRQRLAEVEAGDLRADNGVSLSTVMVSYGAPSSTVCR